MDTRVGSAIAICVLLVLAGCAGTVTEVDQNGPPVQATPTEGSLSVHFINVGQGHAVLVVGPTGETMLIDTGHWEDEGKPVIDHLEGLGIDRVDYLVTSHSDADHIGGHAEVIEHFETEGEGIGAVYDPGIAASSETYEAYLDAVERHEIPLYKTLDGDSIPLAGARVAALSPPEGYLADDDRNENSLVLHVRFGSASFLLPGDAEHAGEEYLLDEHDAALSATVLQAGHHGSSSSSSAAFLDQVDPQVAVISSGYDSPYGHPHEEVLGRLADRSIRTYWTAVHGTVAIQTDGQGLTVSSQRDATTDPRSLYSAPAIAPGATDPLEPRVELSGGEVGTVAEATPESGTPASAGTGTTTETRTATDGGTKASGDSRLAIAEFHGDAEGDDRENLNGEYVVFENTGDGSLDLSGWTIADESGHTFEFPTGTTLDPGGRVTLYTGSGTSTDSEFYWGESEPVWNNDGDTVIVRDASGEVVLEESQS